MYLRLSLIVQLYSYCDDLARSKAYRGSYSCIRIHVALVLSFVKRLKHTVLPYNYLYIYACLCARPA
eukprot:COSAG05_NODE_24_length_31553_cov_12.138647_1_plen_67_part_00